MIQRITQSFMLDMRDYLAGNLCGNIVKEKWVNDQLIELDSDSADLGCYFEYILTEKILGPGKGTLPKNGKIPKCGMYANGKQRLEPYERAHKNADRVIAYLNEMGLEVVSAGKKLVKGNREGTLDLICRCTKDITFHDGSTWKIGDEITIDLKYSGLIADKWSRFGWAGMLEEGPHLQKIYHGTQAIQYHYIGGGRKFYFLVVSSKNEEDILFIYVPITESATNDHLAEGNALYEKFQFIAGINGFTPRPDVAVCNSCQIKENCKDRHTYPHPKTSIL